MHTHIEGTARLVTVCARGDTAVLTLVSQDDPATREKLILTYALYIACGKPAKGMLLEGETLDTLRDAHKKTSALLAAERSLAVSFKSARALYRHLRGKGHAHADALAAVKHAEEKGWIREDTQLALLVVQCAEKKLWGRHRLLAYLMSKGYDRTAIEKAIDSAVQEGSLDFSHLRERLIEKKTPQTQDELKKLLYLHGFSS